MKLKLLLALLFISTCAFGGQTTFNIKYSEPLAVFVFMQNLSAHSAENVFKTKFEQSKYHTDKYKKIIAQFEQLTIDYSYSFEAYPYASKIPMQTRDILKKNMIEANGLNDFKLRSIGILPINTLNELTASMAAFIPVYNELIYDPNKEKFEQQLQDISEYAKVQQIEGYFATGLQFYDAAWDSTIPFEIALYPFPDADWFTGQAFYNNFVCAVQPSLKDYKDLFSVMLHEIYHIVYDEQSLTLKTKIVQYFKENKSSCSNYAYLLLNEVLATAIGNGYVYEQLSGHQDNNGWYYQMYINLMARKIYPLVKTYISEHKAIDKNFIDQYIKLYATNFPGWINEPEHIMAYRYIISANNDDFNTINRMFRYRSYAEYETELTAAGIEKMQQTPLTKVIIVTQDHAGKLSLIKSKFKELKNWSFKPKENFAYKTLLADKSQLIIINQHEATTESLLKSIQ